MAVDALSRTFVALADPTRRAILARLAQGEASVSELAEPFRISLPAVSKHLKMLERAGLITRGAIKQWRPCRLESTPLRNASQWLERYRRFWDASLDRLVKFVEEESCTPKPSTTPSPASPSRAGSKPRRRRSTLPGPSRCKS
jgi:DNA-binding transcriptional ArsR family regulator